MKIFGGSGGPGGMTETDLSGSDYYLKRLER